MEGIKIRKEGGEYQRGYLEKREMTNKQSCIQLGDLDLYLAGQFCFL